MSLSTAELLSAAGSLLANRLSSFRFCTQAIVRAIALSGAPDGGFDAVEMLRLALDNAAAASSGAPDDPLVRSSSPNSAIIQRLISHSHSKSQQVCHCWNAFDSCYSPWYDGTLSHAPYCTLNLTMTVGCWPVLLLSSQSNHQC